MNRHVRAHAERGARLAPASYGDGGRSSDPYLLGSLAVVLVIAMIAEWRAGT